MREVIFSNKTEMITAIHLWKGISWQTMFQFLHQCYVTGYDNQEDTAQHLALLSGVFGVLPGPMSVSSCMILNL